MSEEKYFDGLDRRDFLKFAAVAGAGLSPLHNIATHGAENTRPQLTPLPGELDEATVSDLQTAMESSDQTSEGIVEYYLNRIDEIDRNGPSLRSVIETNPDAISIARNLDRERANGRTRGQLHGIPVMVKDNIGTADRMTTTAGSYALEGSIPPEDSFIVRRLREAGAIVLGKANLSEWANFRSTNSSSGWSGRGGQCRNPYFLHRNPCGSSSGSAVSVSANLTALSLGTETNGSIVCPSSANGVVGIKPTVGLWSRSTIIPISHTQDTAGPITRTVRDGAILLGALTGVDPKDSATQTSRGNSYQDYTQFLDPDGLRGTRIGVVRSTFGFDARVDTIMEEALSAMGEAGATVVDEVAIPNRDEMRGHTFNLLLYEFKAGLNTYLNSLGPAAPIKTLADAIAFNESNADREMPYFRQEIFELAQAKGPLSDSEYQDALAAISRYAGPEGIDLAMDEHRLDALVGPTGGPAWVTDHVNGDHFGGSSSSPAARSGYPNVTVPAGHVFGLPVGISFFGRKWSEPNLLRIAYSFEQLTKIRTVPAFRSADSE